MTTKRTALQYIIEKYDISKTWLGAQIGMTPQGFYYALKQRKLTEQEAEQLQEAIRSMGRDLTTFEVPRSVIQEAPNKKVA